MGEYLRRVKTMLMENSAYNLRLWRMLVSVLELAGVEGYPPGDGHDKNHIFRVMNNVVRLQKVEGGDLEVLLLASVLHDIHRHMGSSCEKPVATEMIVKNILSQVHGISEGKKCRVWEAIEKHEQYWWDGACSCPDPLEVKILRDGDNLDAIGAIGCARTFAFGAIHGIPEYDFDIPVSEVAYEDGQWEASTLHHMQRKLFRIVDALHTKTARRMAKSRIAFVRRFYNEFKREVLGEI